MCWRLSAELASRTGQPNSHLAQKAPLAADSDTPENLAEVVGQADR